MTKRGYESQKTGQKVDELLDKIDNLNVPEWALQESKPSYTAQEVHALPENTSIPRNTSDLTNDMGYISHESDPTVPSWAKQPTKPAYTAEEVGALPSDTPVFSGDYNDLRNKPTIPTVPENVSAFNNDAGYLTSHQDISGKEDKSNKVTSLSAQSTDTQYPSAKAVFDELESKQDTINDLGSIRSGASAGATAYQKPQAGIPESDLAQGVKDKMNEKEVFWATYGTTTAAEIDAAVAAGKMVFCYHTNHLYALSDLRYDQPIYFSTFIASTARYYLLLNRSTNAWSGNIVNHEIYNNKKTTITGNESSNVYYPSTKAVADYVDNVVGDKADIGDILFANFSRLTPKKTFEYDVSDTAYHPLFSRANTGISQLMSEVDDIVKFRITVTGTNIYARVDVVVRFQPSLNAPCIMAWNENSSSSATYSGIVYINTIFPKTLNSGYDWFIGFKTYNYIIRHFKVEVFEDTENITWVESLSASSYDSTYYSLYDLEIYLRRGLCANGTWHLPQTNVRSADSAGSITSFLPAYVGGTMPLTGDAIIASTLVVFSGQKIYNATNKNIPVDCDCGVCMTAGFSGSYAPNQAVSYSVLRQKSAWGNLTGDPALTFDTFARGDQVYLRCTLGQDGKIYPDGHLSNVKSAGYTWVHIGTAASATAINLDTCGKPFITLNNDGKVTHINGTAVMDSSMSKWGVVSQTQTWSGTGTEPRTYVMSNLVYGWIPQANIDLFVSAGAVFNETSGYFEIEDLKDISYQEMENIYQTSISALYTSVERGYYGNLKKVRCVLPIRNSGATLSSLGYMCAYSEFEQFTVGGLIGGRQAITNIASAFNSAYNLRKIGYFRMPSATVAQTITNCYSLEELYIGDIKTNLTVAQSSLLSVDSVLYMINNEASTSAITITLHPTAYARAIADSDVQAALQAHTNVSLASA